MQCTTVELHSPHAKFRDEGDLWYDGNNAEFTSTPEPYYRAYLYGSWDDWEEGISLSNIVLNFLLTWQQQPTI